MAGRFEYKTIVATVYVVSLFVQIMDGTIVNVAIPTLAREFGVERSVASWTVLSLAIALSASIPAAGWLGDRFGLKRMFVWAMVGFTVASLLCGVAQSIGQLILFRGMQGMFSGLITPIGAALVFKAFPLSERADASRRIITVVVLAPAIGPVLGGFIIDALDWRWIFFVNLPIGIVAVWFAQTRLIEDIHPDPGRLDWAGLSLSAVGLGSLVFGISQGSDFGWSSAWVIGALVLAVASLTVLVVVELRVEKPLLELRLFRTRVFRAVSLFTVPSYAGFLALIFILPLYLDTAGFAPSEIGLMILPQPVGVMVGNQLAGRWLYRRLGPRWLMVGGSIAAATIGFLAAGLRLDSPVLWIIALMFMRGVAMGLIFLAVQTAVYAQTSPQDTSRATALFSSVRQFAPALGVAMAATVLASVIGLPGGGESTDLTVLEAGYQRALFWGALPFVLSAGLGLFVRNADAAETMARR